MYRISKKQQAETAPLPVIDPVELMMAAVGIKAIVSRKVERITDAKLEGMHRTADRLHKQVELCITGEPEEYEPGEHDYRATLLDLAQGWDVTQVQEMIEQFPTDFLTDGAALAVRSQEIIKAMLRDYPISNYQTVAGSDQLAPSNTKMFRFVSVLEVLDHPECIPYLIHCGGLLQSQVKAMRAVYPTMSEFIDASLFDAITRAKAKDPDFQLPFHTEYGVKSWWGRPPISDQSLAKAQMVAKASSDKQKIEQQQEINPPSRSKVQNSPDATALEKAEAASG
jgi:hypothetical protein